MSIMGTRVLRTEDPRLLTSGGVYTDDLRLPELTGAAYVTIVRSPVATISISTPSTGFPETAVKNAMSSSTQTTGSRSPDRAASTRPAGRTGSTTASAHPAAAPALSVPGCCACRSSGLGAARLTRTS